MWKGVRNKTIIGLKCIRIKKEIAEKIVRNKTIIGLKYCNLFVHPIIHQLEIRL